MEKVIPNSLNYADLKPEVIENRVKLVKFIPNANPRGATGGQVIRFDLRGNGFFDPYSSYIKFDLRIPNFRAPNAGESTIQGKFLDRSAHSIIERLILRS